MVVDKEGWDQTTALMNETLDKVMDIQAQAQARLAKSGEEGMTTKVELLHFPSPSKAS